MVTKTEQAYAQLTTYPQSHQDADVKPSFLIAACMSVIL